MDFLLPVTLKLKPSPCHLKEVVSLPLLPRLISNLEIQTQRGKTFIRIIHRLYFCSKQSTGLNCPIHLSNKVSKAHKEVVLWLLLRFQTSVLLAMEAFKR